MDDEDQKTQDARVLKLWQALDTKKEGQLNLVGLKQGLRKINHPLKNADALLSDVLKAVDSNGDGHIEFAEFRDFVEHAERELWQLFKSIDRDHNGQLDKGELKSAFERSGIRLPPRKLDEFFCEVDVNHDGVITFDEWRTFLLFIPANTPSLRAVLSYYSSTVTVNAEGDVHVSDETVEGLGKLQFFQPMFGAVFKILKPPPPVKLPMKPAPPALESFDATQDFSRSDTTAYPLDPGDLFSEYEALLEQVANADFGLQPKETNLLTGLLPNPGYFLAGGIAGVVSRTATAPLDRLKVYLIAQVDVKNDAINAAKTGAPVKAVKTAARPLIDASRALWKMGGMKSLFAGNGLNVVKVMPESAIKFGSYEASKRAMARLEGHNDPDTLQPWSQFFAAGMGGIFSQFCVYPLDTLKFRMQCETVAGGPQGNKLIANTAKKMWAQSGVRAYYRGLPMGLAGMFPYSAIDLTTFENLKKFITRRNARVRNCSEEDAAPGNFATASIGAVSGAVGASAVYPVNLLRTRLQSQGTVIHPPTYTGIVDVTLKTIKGEGWRGLFKGITPNLLKVVPAVSITYVVYDNSKRILGLR